MTQLFHSLRLLPVTALLLVGLSACSEKDDPAANEPATGSYNFEGKILTCKSTASKEIVAGYEYLKVYLEVIETPQRGNPDGVILKFRRPADKPKADYEPAPVDNLVLYHNVGNGSVRFNKSSLTYKLTKKTISGTFSGEASTIGYGGNPVIYSTVTAGTFNYVKLPY
jgi:hypothetical protein